jgi:hypothetical protein
VSAAATVIRTRRSPRRRPRRSDPRRAQGRHRSTLRARRQCRAQTEHSTRECSFRVRLSHKITGVGAGSNGGSAGAGTAAIASLYSVVGWHVGARPGGQSTTKSRLAGFVRQPRVIGAQPSRVLGIPRVTISLGEPPTDDAGRGRLATRTTSRRVTGPRAARRRTSAASFKSPGGSKRNRHGRGS